METILMRDRLTQIGFQIAAVPFVGTDGPKYFASRLSESTQKNHFFVVDFSAETLVRSSCKDATFGAWSIDDACREFGPQQQLASAPFLDRLKVMGFRLLPSTDPVSTAIGLANYHAGIGDGSRWFVCGDSEGLIRYDVSPWLFYRLEGTRLVECETGDDWVPPVEQAAVHPQQTRLEVLPAARAVDLGPVEHSGKNLQEALF